MRAAAVVVVTFLSATCAPRGPVPPPAVAEDTCPPDSDRRTGTFVVEYGDPRAGGVAVIRYVLAVEQANVVPLQVDDVTMQPFGGAVALHGKRVNVGLLRADSRASERQVCSITIL